MTDLSLPGSRHATSVPGTRAVALDERSDPPAVSFRTVTKRYGEATALEALSLDIPIGQTVALLGPNGAGKSTAMGIMLGLLSATNGDVRTLGLEPRQAVGTGRIGAMLQASGLPAHAEVGELVDFSRRLYAQPLSREAILERAGLTALAGRRVEGLSGGEAQRVRFALAIAGDPDLLFLDEPTVGMDVETRRAFWSDMRRSASEGRTILFATHYLEEADQVADRIVVLDRGRVVADGTSGSIKAGVAERTVRFTLSPGDAPAPDRAALSALPCVASVEIHADSVTLTTHDADETVRALVRSDLPFRDLEVSGADLESAFVALTGNGVVH